jgi:hypothetical protein
MVHFFGSLGWFWRITLLMFWAESFKCWRLVQLMGFLRYHKIWFVESDLLSALRKNLSFLFAERTFLPLSFLAQTRSWMRIPSWRSTSCPSLIRKMDRLLRTRAFLCYFVLIFGIRWTVRHRLTLICSMCRRYSFFLCLINYDWFNLLLLVCWFWRRGFVFEIFKYFCKVRFFWLYNWSFFLLDNFARAWLLLYLI